MAKGAKKLRCQVKEYKMKMMNDEINVCVSISNYPSIEYSCADGEFSQ